MSLAPLSDPDGARMATPKRRQPDGWVSFIRGMKVKGMTLYRKPSVFIPLTMIPLTDLAVFNTTAHTEI